MPNATALPVFANTTSSKSEVSEIVDSLVSEGIMCVRISIQAKGFYPKTLKGGFAPEDINKKAYEMAASDPKAPPFPAMTATIRELNSRVASLKRRLVRGYSPQSGRTEYFVATEKFEEIQKEIESVKNWLEEQKRLLVETYDLANREWESKCDSMIAFMGQRINHKGEAEYSQDYIETVQEGWKAIFPERANIRAMNISFSHFPITSVRERVENEMVAKAIEDIYSVFASSVQEAAREVNKEIENCLQVLAKGAKDKRSSKAPFTALHNKIEQVKSFLYSGDSEISRYLGEILKTSEANLATAGRDRLEEIQETLTQLKEKTKSPVKQAKKISGHISAVDVSEIPLFDR